LTTSAEQLEPFNSNLRKFGLSSSASPVQSAWALRWRRPPAPPMSMRPPWSRLLWQVLKNSSDDSVYR